MGKKQFSVTTAVLALSLFACLRGGPWAENVEAASAAPPELSRLSRAYLESGGGAERKALLDYAHRAEGRGRVLAFFAAGMGDHHHENYAAAAGNLKKALDSPQGGSLEMLGDYAVYYRARSLARDENHGGAAWVVVNFAGRYPKSRLAPAAAQLRVESLIRSENLGKAKEILLASGGPLAEAARLYLLGRVLELEGEKPRAVEIYRRAYYFHPLSEPAERAEQQLNGLRRQMGSAYPDAPPDWRRRRGDILFDARRYADAHTEYRLAARGLDGRDREHAEVRAAASDYHRLRTTLAYQRLLPLKVSDPELAAERLYYLGECARRKGRVAEFEKRAEELKEQFPGSPWYEEALFSLGNYYLLQNDGAKSAAYYARAAREIPEGKYAALAHWKVCWRAWLDRDPRAESLLEEHVQKYPQSPQASAAIFWLGRALEKRAERSRAASLYATIVERFPHYYYGYLARGRLREMGEPQLAGGVPQWVAASLPAPRKLADQLQPETGAVLQRGRLLFDLGLGEEAEKELLTADYRSSDAHHIGLELFRQLSERETYGRAVRYMKRYGYGYLRMPFEAAPREFWEGLYPLPWDQELRRRTAPHQLDPYLVAGLIRQESEFNPAARSRAGALGLMQILPATGRGIARRLGVANFSARLLYRPDLSLRFGTFHLKQVLDRFENRLELSLAAYNAGEHRAEEWITWADFEEPAEFVETIPFTETRNYVQSVLRNAAMYRALYADDSSRFAQIETGN